MIESDQQQWQSLINSWNMFNNYQPKTCFWNEIHKLILIKILKPSSLLSIYSQLTNKLFHKNFMEINPVNLQQVYYESSLSTPILIYQQDKNILLSNIIKELSDKLNKNMNQNEIQQLYVGQDNFQQLKFYLLRAMKQGRWIIITNCQNNPKFVEYLDEIFIKLPQELNKEFRLFYQVDLNFRLPYLLMAKSNKIMIDHYYGFKQSLQSQEYYILFDNFNSIFKLNLLIKLIQGQNTKQNTISFYKIFVPLVTFYYQIIKYRTFLNMNQNIFNEQNRSSFKRLAFGLSIYHALITQRQQFGSQAYNMRYNFLNDEYRVGISVLDNYLQQLDENAPIQYDILEYLLCDIQYAGKIKDLEDQKILRNFFRVTINDQYLNNHYNFSSIDRYKVSFDKQNLEYYKIYIFNAPSQDKSSNNTIQRVINNIKISCFIFQNKLTNQMKNFCIN